jgi:hypothetical protein
MNRKSSISSAQKHGSVPTCIRGSCRMLLHDLLRWIRPLRQGGGGGGAAHFFTV